VTEDALASAQAAGEALPERAWSDAAWAAALLAVDPQGLGGAVVRAGAGPVRDRWAQDLRALLPAALPLRRMPVGIADERLLGGLDLAATLRTGKPVAQRGLLAESDGGVVAVPMAERLGAGTAARLCSALDSGAVSFERDGISTRWPARVAVLAYDEGTADDAPLPSALKDRLAFLLDLRALPLRGCGEAAASAEDIATAREHLRGVQLGEDTLQALCGCALQLGVDSPRASLLAVRAARAVAALAGHREVAEEDAVLAARLVLGPRATRVPQAPPEAEAQPEAPAPETPEEAQQEAAPPPPATEATEATDAYDQAPQPPAPPEPQAEALEDRIIEAVAATLPAGLLAALLGGDGGQQGGRVGALTASPRSGRPVGTRRGEPRGGARLNLIETLRAAAPWQKVRRAAAPMLGGKPRAGRGRGRICVEVDDLRVSRLQQRAATATLFVVDASGSSALHRLSEAKGAVTLLLADCYVRRDQVAVIAFRGKGAELLLPPTRSLVRAKRSLAELPGGGGTPLASGLEAAMRLAAQVRRAGATPIVVLLTDGRGNIARNGEPGRAQAEHDALHMARQMRAARLTTLLVDTSPKPAAAAQQLAVALGAQYRALPHAGAVELSAAVRALPQGAV
jgi:magnesium chelatase subunit D